MKTRAAFYIDGFNLYHAIDDFNEPFLKWLNLWALAENLIPSHSQSVCKVVYCTAIKNSVPNKAVRHSAYIGALSNVGVVTIKGHFINETKTCRHCDESWNVETEKQGDVNVAVSLIRDAFLGVYDHCYIISADGDLIPAISALKADHPDKVVTIITPPNKHPNKGLVDVSDHSIKLNRNHIERNLFGGFVPQGMGNRAIIRPEAYAP